MSICNEEMRGFIGRTCLSLDDENYESFLKNCTDRFSYRVTTYSPELGKEMVWLEHDRQGYESLVKMLPQHVRLQGRFTRQAVVYDVAPDGNDGATVISQLTVVHTDLEGESRLLLAGRYIDKIENGASGPLLASREVRLDTRVLGPGIHTPI